MLLTLLKTATSAFRCHTELLPKNAALWQLLATYAAEGDRPRIPPAVLHRTSKWRATTGSVEAVFPIIVAVSAAKTEGRS
jgi:hypothetical protein